MRVRVVRSEVPKAFEPLLAPARYKGAFGGRGAAKSHFFAERLLLRCLAKPTRAVCIREVQDSIRDSIRQLLVDKTQSLGIGYGFDILDATLGTLNNVPIACGAHAQIGPFAAGIRPDKQIIFAANSNRSDGIFNWVVIDV